MEIIGHRGACYEAPENTLASINLAWEQGADAVEIDVHLSSDNRIMVMHDASTRRTAGIDLIIAQTPSEELRKLDVGGVEGAQFAGERIPFLEEVLDTIPAGRGLYIEVKCGTQILPVLSDVLAGVPKDRRITIISFNVDVVTGMKQLMPQFPTLELRSVLPLKSHGVRAVKDAAAHGVDGLDLHYMGITRSLMDAAQSAGLPVYAWTVNNPARAASLKRMGVVGLTTDRPGFIMERLGDS